MERKPLRPQHTHEDRVDNLTEVRALCALLHDLAGRPPGEEPTWELLAAVQLLLAVIGPAERAYLFRELSRRQSEGWRVIITPTGAKFFPPFPGVCDQEEPHHS